MTALEIFNRLRGFTPFPGCYTFFDGRRLEIIKAHFESRRVCEETEEGFVMTMRVDRGKAGPDNMDNLDKFEPGIVCDVARDSFVVACGGATRLRITEVQPEGKRAMPARDFLNGAKLQVGAKLGRRIES
jgi:methionyl-tRNA formyltransferase